ncbi:S-adenosyl methyltransferase [Streptomyces abyssalis]|uniref:S-adenosyl methyltransferase n=1 Tax=Streptomyces abyssalis TaxID=933944 RepID=A0A1E7JMW1_9ACTN|nr:SAM-dependent methyltransferase [Streptomyces abyssalis]OEU86998.1 S-adenosyl methyltransferase [Streptomyces abyssalis]OEU89617.1 S-adenosyl methyltransferase [Streptomyces abyssalis]
MHTPEDPSLAEKIRADTAHSARVWNYLLGGRDNFRPDRDAGDIVLKLFPGIARLARLQRRFLSRAVRYLAAEAGIRQFLDVGTGLPTVDNTHEVAQRVAPESRIVYVDNDPLVLVHAQALLTSSREGACDYIDADVRDPATILEAASRTLDFGEPVALTLLGTVGQIPDSDDPSSVVARLMEPLPSGSHLALSDGTDTNEVLNEAIAAYNANSAGSYHLRSADHIAGFFDGLDVVEPGIVTTSGWRPDAADPQEGPGLVDAVCGVGRKP